MTPGFEMRRWAALGLMAASLVVGCRKDTPPPEKKEEKVAPTPTASAARKPRAVDEGVDVPTEEDFEEAVEKQITAESNLQKELDQIEKQMQAQQP